eukprot:1956462-Rhodomonas_salina.2
MKECQYQQSSGILERQASDDEEEAMSGQMRTVELLYREDDAYGRKQYIGQIRDGLRHGLGVMRWTDGAKYEGEWRDDKVVCAFVPCKASGIHCWAIPVLTDRVRNSLPDSQWNFMVMTRHTRVSS